MNCKWVIQRIKRESQTFAAGYQTAILWLGKARRPYFARTCGKGSRDGGVGRKMRREKRRRGKRRRRVRKREP